jgi:hypothetical protein
VVGSSLPDREDRKQGSPLDAATAVMVLAAAMNVLKKSVTFVFRGPLTAADYLITLGLSAAVTILTIPSLRSWASRLAHMASPNRHRLLAAARSVGRLGALALDNPPVLAHDERPSRVRLAIRGACVTLLLSVIAMFGPSPLGTGVAEAAPGVRAYHNALTYLGVPYCWNGVSRSCVDNSGLMMLAWMAAGVTLPHFSGAQMADCSPVTIPRRHPLEYLKPGDLLFWGPSGTQVAMYIGNGKMIEAPYSGAVVWITPVRFGDDFAGARQP